MRRTLQPAWYAYDDNTGYKKKRICRRPPCRFCLAWITFILLLTFIYDMSLPSLPRWSRRIGYQAYEVLASSKSESNVTMEQTIDIANNFSSVNVNPIISGPAFPLNIYAPLLPNTVPLTEITVIPCYPILLQQCKPASTPEKDTRLGVWVMVDRSLDPDTAESRSQEKGDEWLGKGVTSWWNKFVGSFQAKYIFYRRSRRTDVPHIIDLRLVETGSDNRPVGGNFAGWHRVKMNLKSSFFHIGEKAASIHLYYRTKGGTAEDQIGEEEAYELVNTTPQTNEATLEPVTELDVTYGPGPVWPGFESLGMLTKAAPALSRAKVTLSARRKPIPLPEMPVNPQFKSDGTFKILQVGDIHFGVRHEPCREVDWESAEKPCVGDTDTLQLMERWLDEEKPDLVVFSGDQLNGQTTSWDEKSVMPKYLMPVIKRKIAWASIMGNHDSTSGVLTRSEQQALLGRLPYSRTRVGPGNLHDGEGAGNYYIKVHSPTPDNMHVFTLYFLDSGVTAPREKLKPWAWTGYDYIRWDQIDWFLGISNKVSKIERPYNPDGASDLKPLWNRTLSVRGLGSMTSSLKRRGTHLSKPKALLFTHIPVPEAFATPDKDEGGKDISWGPMGETSTIQGAQKNGGIFSAIKAQGDDKDVIGFFHGHMHNNAGCRKTSSLWVCFNGGSSFAGYGKLGLERRTRVINISKFGERIDTWHRMEKTLGAIEPHTLYEEPL